MSSIDVWVNFTDRPLVAPPSFQHFALSDDTPIPFPSSFFHFIPNSLPPFLPSPAAPAPSPNPTQAATKVGNLLLLLSPVTPPRAEKHRRDHFHVHRGEGGEGNLSLPPPFVFPLAHSIKLRRGVNTPKNFCFYRTCAFIFFLSFLEKVTWKTQKKKRRRSEKRPSRKKRVKLFFPITFLCEW